MAYLIVGFAVLALLPYFQSFFGTGPSLSIPALGISVSTYEAFAAIVGTYALVLPLYYWYYPGSSKAGNLVRRALGMPVDSKSWIQDSLPLLLKFFFAPLMVHWLLGHVGGLFANAALVLDSWKNGMRFVDSYQNGLYLFLFQAILFVDVLLFSLGYLVEARFLKNEIVSVDSTFLGWFVCLVCYPPFNWYVGWIFPWSSSDFPNFLAIFPAWVHVWLTFCMLLCFSFYAWASVALGLRASNLTNRWIVERGPYRFLRHPAYVAKNLAWWIGSMPVLIVTWNLGFAPFASALLAPIFWTVIYVLRALTEERHLRLGENGYERYAKRVPYRFLPGVL